MSENITPEGNNGVTGVTRRRFLVGAAGAAGGLALAGGLAGLPLGKQVGLQIASAQALKSDLDIVQFALTLEHFEDAAYRAANASGLLKGTAADLFKTFGDQEHQHAVALTSVVQKLGGTPVAEQAKYNLPQLQSQDQIVSLFATIEEVGASAYLGAAPLLKDKTLLAAASSIANIEARHAASLKAFMNDPMPSPAFAKPLSYDEVIAAVSPFLNAPTAPAGKYYTIDDPAPSLAVAVARANSVQAANLAYFADTGHTISGQFLAYWNQHGGLTQFGFPITEPYRGMNSTDGKEYIQQYFQRNRFEYHPEYKGTQFEVELGLLGAEQLLKDMMGGR